MQCSHWIDFRAFRRTIGQSKHPVSFELKGPNLGRGTTLLSQLAANLVDRRLALLVC
jgi:hypothetical protein